MTPTERSEQKPSNRIGLFATLRAALHVKGTRAPSSAPPRPPSAPEERAVPQRGMPRLPVPFRVRPRSAPNGVFTKCPEWGMGWRAAQQLGWGIATATCALLAAGLLFTGAASAAITHEYEKPLSETFSKGVPPGCVPAGEPPIKEPPEGPCLSGALTGANAITVDQGHAWIADQAPGGGGGARIDRFNAASGVFEGPQLVEEGGASELGRQLGVGHAFLSEQVYVDGSHQVAVFDGGTGKLAGLWSGSTALGSGELTGTAVDDTPLGPDAGDVYVATKGETPAENVVRVLNPEELGLKAGEEPKTLVAELTGTCANEGEELPCSGGSNLVPFPVPGPLRIAVSSVNGDVFVAQISREIDVFEPVSGGLPGAYRFLRTITGTPTGPGKAVVPFSSLGEMAVDGGTGELYIVDDGTGVVDEFGPAGEYLSQIPGTPAGRFPELTGIGVDGVTHHVFVGDAGHSPSLAVFGGNIVIPDVTTEPAGEVHATHVQLRGTVKLDKAGSAECFFEYGTSTSYGTRVSCEPATVTESEPEPSPVKRTITGLQPDTTYFYRVSATNELGAVKHTNFGAGAEDEGTFTTTGPGLHGESVSEVASTAASLDATINPNGLPTSYYFQYTTSPAGTGECEPTGTAKCSTIPASPEALGSVPGDQNFSQRLQSLAPSTTYHYRVVVVSEPKLGEIDDFTESDAIFTTQPPAGGFALPDGRAWELVTPPDKHGATPRERKEGVTQASSSGGAISYLTTKPIEEGAPGYGYLFEQVLSTRGTAGWESQDLSAPHAGPPQAQGGYGEEYRAFSEDLSDALVEPIGEFTSLRPEVFPADTESTPYLRHDLTCAASPSTCYEPLLTAAPPYADVPPGTHFGPKVAIRPGWSVMATTPDLTHVILGEFLEGSKSKQPLKNGAPSNALYEWSAGAPFGEGELQLVSVLPDTTPTSGVIGTVGTQNKGNSARAVSRDGARVVWTGEGDGGLYLTDMLLGRSVRLDVPQAGCEECGAGNVTPIFQTMDNGGSRVLFSDSQQLLPGAGAGDSLYECAIVIEAGAPRCELHDVAPGASLLGETIVGASEDGSYVYFVSNSVAGDGVGHGAVNGNCRDKGSGSNPGEEEWKRTIPTTACNLYMVHHDSGAGWEPPTLVGVLSGDDEPAWTWIAEQRPARVSPDGRWLAFMSNRSLTGYDNRDVHSGRPDEEVFLYHARSGAPGRVVCASCDPTGARPTGFEVGSLGKERLATSEEWPEDAWLAGGIPGWTAYTFASTSLYQSRYLFDSGRLFFMSSDALVPQDVNNQVDVYQYEPPNTASEPPPNDSCSTGSSTYDSATGGCANLISSGTSHQESGFYDASATGDDVFFLTSESLVPQDPGGARSIYDAHVCGAEGVPCTAAPAAPSKCTTADACWPAPPPQPEVFGAPAGATFSGPGNQTAPPPPKGSKPKTAEQLRIEKLNVALKLCHKDKKKAKRQKCEKQARSKYGTSKAKKSSHRAGSK